MNKLLEIYNETVNDGTGFTPNYMEENEAVEIRYIIKRIYTRERRRKITDFELKEGTFVRYIIPNDKNYPRKLTRLATKMVTRMY